MIRESMLSLFLLVPLHALAAAPAPTTAPAPATTATAQAPATATAPVPAAEVTTQSVPAPPAAALPPMYFLSTVAGDELFAALKADPALASLDKELVGSPLTLMVTHTLRPTAGGQAAGLLSAVLSGSTLGLIPIVSNDRLVIKYEVLLNGKTVTSYSFERTATRAQNLWTAGNDGYGGLGKAGMEWVKSTAAEVASKVAMDPAMLAVRNEIDFYFSAKPVDRK